MILQIPIGAKFALIPGTESEQNPKGLMVEVYWEKDEHGTLCIAGHSSETPVPPNADPNSFHRPIATGDSAPKKSAR